MSRYLAAFDRMAEEGNNILIVGEDAGRIVATCQLTFISGLSLRAARRAQVESVRVASRLRGRGIGEAISLGYAEQGAAVAVVDVNEAAGAGTATRAGCVPACGT